MLALVLLSIAGSVFCGRQIKNEVLVTKGGVTVESTGYPEQLKDGNTHYWVLNGFVGSKMLVSCDEIKVTESENCKENYLLITNGIKRQMHCGNKRLDFESFQPQVTIVMELKGGSGSFKCRAKLEDPSPEYPIKEINVHLGENSLHLLANEKKESPFVETWVFAANAGSNITVVCNEMSVYDNNIKDPNCDRNYIAFDLGNTLKKACGVRFGVKYTSFGNKLAVRLITQNVAVIANARCVVAVGTGRHFKDIESEEVDSKEYGNGQGDKKTTCDCGRANKGVDSRVIYGKNAGENEFPWAVSLQIKSISFHFCGASIVTPRHVVSAAHCTQGQQASEVVVLVGATHLIKSKNKQAVPVLRIINHNYQKTPTRRDISVLITAERIQYSKFVGPICIPYEDPKMVGKYITAVGWGRMADDEKATRDEKHLQKTHMRVVDPAQCAAIWNDHHDKDLSQICTWSNHTDICLGDSGGPVTWVDKETNRYFLVGLPSLCDGCRLTMPSIHTAVHFYYNWLLSIISQYEFPEEKLCTKF